VVESVFTFAKLVKSEKNFKTRSLACTVFNND